MLFFPLYFLYGQPVENLNKKIDSLNAILSDVDVEITELTKRKNELLVLRGELNQRKSNLEQESELPEGIPVVINYLGGILRDQPNLSGIELSKIPSKDTVLVFPDYEKPFFKAQYGNKVGYISYGSLEKNEKILDIVNKSLTKENPRLARLTKKFGSQAAQKILKGQYWLGMTDAMARESLGSPDSNNRSTGSWGVHEQWVYSKKNLYLYFENGRLTSIQD
jgi:hypothetical protein